MSATLGNCLMDMVMITQMFEWLLENHLVIDNRGRGLSYAVDRFSKPTRLKNFRMKEYMIVGAWALVCGFSTAINFFNEFQGENMLA